MLDPASVDSLVSEIAQLAKRSSSKLESEFFVEALVYAHLAPNPDAAPRKIAADLRHSFTQQIAPGFIPDCSPHGAYDAQPR